MPPLDLHADEVHVFYRHTCYLDASLLRRLQQCLTPEESEQISRQRRGQDRRDRVVARAVLRRLLAAIAQVDPRAWQFDSGSNGRPEIAAPQAWRNIRFNVSHTAGLVAWAFCWNRDVGIDVESVVHAPALHELSDSFTWQEYARLAQTPEGDRAREIIRTWTLKEAFTKALGFGLGAPFGSFSISRGTGSDFHLSCSRDLEYSPESWRFLSRACGNNFVLSIAVREGGFRSCRFVIHDDFDSEQWPGELPLAVSEKLPSHVQ